MKQFLKSLKKRHIVLASIYLFSILILVIARLSEGFYNVYAKYVFPLWVNTYGRLTSLLPFSFGEALIILGITIVLLTLPSLAVLMIIKKKERKRVLRIYGFSYLCIIAFILLTETLNCFVIYRCSTFGDIYNIPATEHTNAELIELYDFLAAKCNERAGQMQRDDEGLFVLTADLDETAKEAMQNLGREFDRLDGFYVTPKPILNSYFMSQQYLMGMYFPRGQLQQRDVPLEPAGDCLSRACPHKRLHAGGRGEFHRIPCLCKERQHRISVQRIPESA